MKIRPEHLKEYIDLHKNAWPDLLKAAKASGADNLVIYIHGNNSIVFFECPDLDEFYEEYGKFEVVKKWNKTTQPWIGESPTIDGSGTVATIEKVFDLNEQLRKMESS
ncbi:MAG: L-rhamnose mutarotase [Spirochaetota bacterium]